MPFIEPQDRVERVELRAKIRPEIVALVDEYAAFLRSEEWYVVQEVLRKSIEGDRDFQRARTSEGGARPVAIAARKPRKTRRANEEAVA